MPISNHEFMGQLKNENGIITTVEGNTGDSCAERHYAVGHFEIFGYGLLSY